TGVRIGKGAAAGGLAGAAGAAALEVGGRVASKGASKAIQAGASAATPSSTSGASRPAPAAVKVVPMVVDQTPARTPDSSRRIVVDGNGMGRIQRTPTGGVVDISSLPPQPRALPSPRSAELRSRLAIAQG
ncbi:hypothetical protein, partial [Microbacterium sp. UBA837]